VSNKKLYRKGLTIHIDFKNHCGYIKTYEDEGYVEFARKVKNEDAPAEMRKILATAAMLGYEVIITPPIDLRGSTTARKPL